MALILVHKIMIATALVFCALFALRCWVVEQPNLSAGFALATVGLAFYFRWFLRTKTGPDSRTGLDDSQS